jgi:hypothetical protein
LPTQTDTSQPFTSENLPLWPQVEIYSLTNSYQCILIFRHVPHIIKSEILRKLMLIQVPNHC